MKERGQIVEIRYLENDKDNWRERIIDLIISAICTALVMWVAKVSHAWPFE